MGRRRALRESGGPRSRRRDEGKREDGGPPGRLSNDGDDEEILSDEEEFDNSDDEAAYGDVLRAIGRRNKKKEGADQGDEGQLLHEEDEEIGGVDVYSPSDEGEDYSNASGDDDNENGGYGLIDFVDSLGPSTARSTGIDNGLQTLPETEFALPPPSRERLPSTLDGNVSLEALIAPLQDETSFAPISRRVKDLSASSQKIKPPSEPIVARRAERAVTYESARTEATKWVQAVQKERQAEVSDYRPKIDHLVSKPSTRALIDKFVPQPGTMEARVADLLTELGDNDREENSSSAAATASITVQGEGLTRSDDDPEEAKRKLARLKSTRALLFYHERKRYQINKIKSKLYRKIRRKQRKNRVRKEGEGNEDNDGDSQDFEGDKEEERAIARARERATLRHSAMKLLKGHTGLRSARSRDISESARIAKELQQKSQGTVEDEDNLSYDDGTDSSEKEDNEYRDQKTLETIGTNQDSDTAAALVDTKGGLMSMDFMKRGLMKQQEMVKLERDKALNELNCLKNKDQPQFNSDGEGSNNNKAIHNPILDALEPIVMHSSLPYPTGSSSGNKVAIENSRVINSPPQGLKQGLNQGLKDDENPWLGTQKVGRSDETGLKKVNQRKAATTQKSGVSKDVNLDPINAALGALPNHQLSNLEVKNCTNGGVVVTCDDNSGGGGNSVSKKRNMRRRKARAAAKSQKDDEAGRSANGVNNNGKIPHEELVRHAFAAPDLEQAFRDMKADEVERETEEDLVGKSNKRGGKTSFSEAAAGWGSWTGLGAPAPRKPQSLVRAQEAKQKALMQAKEKRKDASLPTVLINGKRQKRSAMLRVAQVPYPFTSREQYEHSMRWPIGPEWNTCQSVRALTKKSELTRGGAIIAPISTKAKQG